MTFSVPSHSLQIRPVDSDDLEAVLEVYTQCEDFLALGPVANASMEMVLKDMELSRAERGIFCGIFTARDEMIGILDYVPDNYQGEPGTAFIELLMLAAPFRNQGIGGAIIRAFEEEVRKDGLVDTILLGAQVNNPLALQFWKRNGYRIISEPKLYADQTIAVDLRKDFEADM